MSAKHTPGPWCAKRTSTNAVEVFAGNYRVAILMPDEESEAIGDMELPLADARLIAAAPMLLEALRGFKFFPNCGSDFCYLTGACQADADEMSDDCPHKNLCTWAYEFEKKARAAIAEAEA